MATVARTLPNVVVTDLTLRRNADGISAVGPEQTLGTPCWDLPKLCSMGDMEPANCLKMLTR
jgi:hypothetical protein